MTPSHSAEAEQAVLGAMMLTAESIDAVACILTPGHFYYPDHAAILGTILRLFNANKPVDVVTVHEAGRHDLMYLNSMAQSCPSERHAGRYAEIVAECWRERELARVGRDIASDAEHRADPPVPAAERVDKAVTALMGIVQGDKAGEPEGIASAAVAFLDRLQDRADGKDIAIPTGLTALDNLTAGGIRPGELWVIGARPSMGKTALTLTVSRNMAATHGVLFLSQEDSKDAMTSRFVAAIGRVNLADIRKPINAPESMWRGVSEAMEVLTTLQLQIDDQGSLTLLDVRRKVQQAKRKGAVHVVVIDYLQLMTGDGDTRNLEMGRIANGLKATAKDLSIGVILLSQLSREADKRAGPPQMSDLRDSGDIEGAADLIGGLHREARKNPTEENKHHAVLHVMKQKNGPTDTLSLRFDGEHQRFSDWSGPAPRSNGKRSYGNSEGMD